MRNAKLQFPVAILSVILLNLLTNAPTLADSTSPRLAAYYDLKMLVCGQTAFQWKGDDRPLPVADDVIQVGVGRDASYVLTTSGHLLTWSESPEEKTEILDRVAWFVAGRSGVFAARKDNTFDYIARTERLFGASEITPPIKIGASVIAASIGDSADYFIKDNNTLFVKGRAHRGQYGDGKLKSSTSFIPVANNVVAIKAHTGHAILLTQDGSVLGTGGNIYGPLGRHGIGDKAILWGEVFTNAVAIATGSSHSLALRPDRSLWQWGRDIGLEPEKIMDGVAAAAADQSSSLALLNDNSLWQWQRGEQPKKHFQCPLN